MGMPLLIMFQIILKNIIYESHILTKKKDKKKEEKKKFIKS